MKKTISLLCTLAVILTLFAGFSLPITASAETYGDFEYWYDEYWDEESYSYIQTVAISGYTGNATDLVIPDTINGYLVTSIGYEAFYGCDALVSVTIPDSVRWIEESAFFDCVALESITIPKSVTYIGSGAFFNCDSLVSVTIPDSVTTIGSSAFSNCEALESVYITDLAAWCEMGFFEENYYSPFACEYDLYLNGELVTDLVIPDAVTHIRAWLFEASSIQSATIPARVKTIDSRAFVNCTALSSITVSADNDTFCDINGVLFTKNKKTLLYYPAGNTAIAYNIPYGVSTIKESAFRNHEYLETILIPKTVTTIEDYVFENCTSLGSVTIPDAVTTIGDYAFSNCYSLTSVTIPDAVTTIGSGAFSGCASLKSVTIGNAVTTIGGYAFSDCNALTSVTIPDAVTTIGEYAFSGCDALKSMTIPDSVTTIRYSAFSGCDSLESVTIGNAVTTIGESAFYNCDALKSVTIGNAVTTIEWYAFAYCWNLEDVYYTGTKAQWKKISIGEDKGGLTSKRIHYSVSGDHWVMTGVTEEPSCEWNGWASYTCDCGYEAVFSIPATGHTLQFIETVEATCTDAGCDVYECTTCWDYVYENYVPGGHTFENNVCVQCGDAVADCLASAHKYANDTYQSWWVRQTGAKSISLTFSPSTYVEDECDYLYIYDTNGELFGAYTGAQLAGAQITVPGDFVEILLVADESMNYYGFDVTDVSVEEGSAENPDRKPGDLNGDGALNANDVAQVFYFVNAVGTLTDEQRLAADVNGDGVVNLYDAARWFYTVNGLI